MEVTLAKVRSWDRFYPSFSFIFKKCSNKLKQRLSSQFCIQYADQAKH